MSPDSRAIDSAAHTAGDAHRVRDRLQRPLRALRISVTDRCNFRCDYCMPKARFGPGHRFLPHREVLSLEEIAQAASAFLPLGVAKFRLTGGEPLLRQNLAHLVRLLAAQRTADEGSAPAITLTTNGVLLARHAKALAAAGLQRVTVSLDAIDPTRFAALSGVNGDLQNVLAGIDAALAAGLAPIKINMVVQRSVNDDQIVPLARAVRERWGAQASLRFIEYMDVGTANGWRLDDVITGAQVRALLQAHWPLEQVPGGQGSDTASRWRYADGGGEVGFINSVSEPFCGGCDRARLSTDGRLYTCLFAAEGMDLRTPLRDGLRSQELSALIAARWRERSDRYSELRAQLAPGEAPLRRIEMHYIGG